MRTREDADRYTLEHYGTQGWQVLSEVHSMEAAMLRARALFKENPAINLRITAHSLRAKKIYPLRAPQAPVAATAGRPGADFDQLKHVTDKLLMAAAGGVAIVILGVIVLHALSMFVAPY